MPVMLEKYRRGTSLARGPWEMSAGKTGGNCGDKDH